MRYLILSWYLLGIKNLLSHAHQTRFWYLLGYISKISDEHPRYFDMGVPPPRGGEGFFSVHFTGNWAGEHRSFCRSLCYKRVRFIGVLFHTFYYKWTHRWRISQVIPGCSLLIKEFVYPDSTVFLKFACYSQTKKKTCLQLRLPVLLHSLFRF